MAGITELITIDNNLEEVPKVIEQFEVFAEKNRLPGGLAVKMSIVFDELLANIILYAFEDKELHVIHIALTLEKNCLTIVIDDDGIPFNPFHKSPPDTTLSIEEREIGGLGIHLVKNLMDSYSYLRRDNKNSVTLIKNRVV